MSGIGPNPLNAISKIYLEQIVEKKDDSYLEPDMKKRQKNNEKARKDMEKMGTSMKNPHFEEKQQGWDAVNSLTDVYKNMSNDTDEVDEAMSSYDRNRKRAAQRAADRNAARAAGKTGVVPGVGYVSPRKERETYVDSAGTTRHKSGAKMEGLDPVGKEDGDVNNDGKKDSTDSYLMKRRKAIGKAMKKKMSEGVRDMDPEKGTAERKARLEKKRGMKMDDHPEYKKEEVEVDEAMMAGPRKDAMKKKEYSAKSGSDRAVAFNIGTRRDVSTSDPTIKSRGGRADKRTGEGDRGMGNAAKRRMKEEMSSWRQDLSEIMTDDIDSKPIKEKNVKNKVTINPKLGEAVEEMGGELIEMTEISEFEFMVEGLRQELVDEGHDPEAVNYALEEAKVTVGHDTAKPEGMRDKLKKKAKGLLGKVAYKGYHAARGAKRAASPMVQRIKTSAKRGVRKAAQKVVDRMSEETVDEAVYGGGETPKKSEDKRMVVTNADKKGNTPAYQKMMAGDKRYKKADHMNEGDGDPCWDTHKQVGMKKKGNRMVPNCVPKNKVSEEMSPQEIALQKKKAMLDKMIAQRRKTDLGKKQDAPTRAMDEEASDRMKDRRMERGGVGGNIDYSKPPGKPNTFGKKKPRSGGMSALDLVKADIRKKHGQGAIMDTKKK
tara:strand:- start:77 stop:2050 length:1974 start_codon:yes stop_codon:yes gene_type:complete